MSETADPPAEGVAERIGDRLLADGHIDDTQLSAALERQQREGGRVGQHLIDDGVVSRQDFYATLADQWGLLLRDLAQQPPAPALLATAAETIGLGWIACDLTADTVVVATSVPPTQDVVVEVREQFGDRAVEFVACTGRDLDQVMLAVRRRESPSGPFPAAAPAEAVRSLGRRGERAEHDDELPVYTVVARVEGGEEGLRAVLERIDALDYPASRLDPVLLVAEGDADTVAALGTVAPPERVRVAVLPNAEFADVVRAHDQGLALAQGRYVVAYGRDDRPARGELRRAVAAFEADLDERLGHAAVGVPLVGLRSARRTLLRHGEPTTSVHCHAPLLRRWGGFGAIAD